MTAVMIALIVLTSLSLLVWISRHFEISHHCHDFLLSSDYPAPATGPKLSAFVAAKDEECCIDACVRGLMSQDYQNLEIFVANDRSSDRTAQIVESTIAGDARAHLINIDHLDKGWCGKNHAMSHAISASAGEWIFMTDADCRLVSPRALSVALEYAQKEKIDLLSVLPSLEMQGFWENAGMPVCSAIMMIWFHPAKVNNPAKPQGYANGAFMLMRREAYERIGTHEAVKSEVNEDMHMAWRMKKQGLNIRVIRNGDLCIVRMYRSLQEMLRGWSRIYYGTFGTVRRVVASLVVLALISLWPYMAALLGLAAGGLGVGPAGLAKVLLGVALTAIVMQLSVIYRFYDMVKARSGLFWSYPLGCGVGLAALVMALGKMRKGAKIAWRNTTYSAGSKV